MSQDETPDLLAHKDTDLSMAKQPHVLTIAGSDSSGGAGVQADLKTFSAFGCYGASVLTGLTAQNTTGVKAVHEVPSDFVLKQLDAVFDDDVPTSLKFGMLTSASTIRALASSPHLSRAHPSRPFSVLDPVMISTSGHTLLPDDAIQALSELFKLVDWITPNIPEAQKLSNSNSQLSSLDDLISLASETARACGIPTILLKGGHCPLPRDSVAHLGGKCNLIWEEGDDEQDTVEVLRNYREMVKGADVKQVVVDILVQEGKAKPTLFVGKHVQSQNTHGTGCTLSSAIAAAYASYNVSLRASEAAAVEIAKQAIAFTRSAIATAFDMGKGHGPLNHSHLTIPRALPQPTPTNPHPFTSYLIQSNMPLWKSYVQHPWVVQLGQGTLPRIMFEHYIKQDYHYLRHYARAHSLGAYKCTAFEDIKAFSEIALYIAKESEMHVSFCKEFGVTRDQLLSTSESTACSAYARYILDVGAQGDVLELYVAIAACLIGYGEVGLWLVKQVETGEAVYDENPYKSWLDLYKDGEYQDAVLRGIENLERRIAADPPSPKRLARLTEIWHEVVRLEREFWTMAIQLA